MRLPLLCCIQLFQYDKGRSHGEKTILDMMKLSMKSLLVAGVALLCNSVFVASADNDTKFMSERRIFLWDVTRSMVGVSSNNLDPTWCNRQDSRKNPFYDYSTDGRNRAGKEYGYLPALDIFDDTRDKLLSMIDAISDENCEIVVLPYTETILDVYEVKSATPENKEKLKAMVLGWDNLKPANTFTGRCLQKVVNEYFVEWKINRVVLLTDGAPSDGDGSALYDILNDWDTRKKHTKYHNNKLVYVMLTDEAVNEQLDTILDNKSDGSGVAKLQPGENITEMLSFSLSGLKQSVYINDLVGNAGSLPAGGTIVLGCERKVGPENRMQELVCNVECIENNLLSLTSSQIRIKDGKLEIPYSFKGSSREFYLNELSSGGVGTVRLTCKIDESCKLMALEGENEVEIEIVVRPEPRAVISLSTK